MKELKGVIALIPTPVTDRGTIDEKGLRGIIDYDMENGCFGVGVAAAIGEGYLLSRENEEKLIKIAVEHMNGRGPIMVGTAALGPAQAVEKCRRAEDLGADAVLTFNPKFRGRKPYSDSELIDHYSAITDAVKIHVVPYSQEDDLIPLETLRRLVDEKRIAHMKYAWNDCEYLKQITQFFGDRLFVFVGADTYTLRYLLLGARGVSTATAAVFPRANAQLLSLVQSGGLDAARKLYNDRIVPWNDCGFYQRWHVCHKVALELMGIIGSRRCLPPLTGVLADYQVEEIAWLLKNQGLIK
ncbi:MAG: dihydrodipicolinate synthase family protein [Pseudomonadota bacterium]